MDGTSVAWPRHKCGMLLSHNEHRDYYKPLKEWLDDKGELVSFMDAEDKARALETDEVWELHWYPDTPVGFFVCHASSFERLLEYANKIQEGN